MQLFTGDDYLHGKLDSIRNKDGIWINTSVFREEGDKFMKHGYYCPDPPLSPDWYAYWTEQRRRCLEGYEVAGCKITGDHYFYLNFCPIKKVDNKTGTVSAKIKGFPDFWDGDYNYFWSREIARKGVLSPLGVDQEEQDVIIHMETKEQAEKLKAYLESLYLEVKIRPNALLGGYDLIIGKSRRKGYSYKNASIAACNFFHRPNSYTMFMAYEKKYLYPNGIFNMTLNYINFINEHTAWTMPSDVVAKQDHIKASYIEYKDGVKLEKGFKSEVQAITFKDNPDAGRGKDAYDIIGEEVGAWGTPGGLKATHSAMLPSVQAGSIKTGMQTYFGTSGDIGGGTADFADMHSRPEAFGFLPFNDIWGENPEKVEGFFHPVQWNMEGFYDEQGNSDTEAAKKAELDHREHLLANGATSTEIQARMQENPTNSSEAFSIISFNNFPVVELKAQLERVEALKLHKTKGTPVKLYYDTDGRCKAKPILDGTATPLDNFFDKPLDQKGCVMLYEQPLDNPPPGLYKIGYDPVRQDSGTSLAAIIVYKGVHIGSMYHSIIVGEYIGRLESPDEIDHVAEKLADLFGAKIMHENEVTGVKNYFRRIKRLGLLAAQPDMVISKNIKASKVARVYGCHMNEQLKDAGERYVKQWLLTILDYDENGDPIRVIDRIYSRRLLQELISYDRKKGNYDLVSALFMCMFQVQEEALDKTYDETVINKNAKKLLSMVDKMYGGKKTSGISRKF